MCLSGTVDMCLKGRLEVSHMDDRIDVVKPRVFPLFDVQAVPLLHHQPNDELIIDKITKATNHLSENYNLISLLYYQAASPSKGKLR